MRALKNIYFHKIFIILFLLSCGPKSIKEVSFSDDYPEKQVANQENNPPEELPFEEYISAYIDEYAGHPNDPDYPSGYIGPTDEVIEQTNAREILDLINSGLDFAKEEVSNEPRFLFALGRAAYLHGYREEAKEWLMEAAENGSAPAYAYLGFILYEDENIDLASDYLKRAIAGGFSNEVVQEVYRACNFDARSEGFERHSVVNALYMGNFSILNSEELIYNYILKIHGSLWEYDILWVAESPEILLELDPRLSLKTQNILGKFGLNTLTDSTLPTAIKDARRLALLYNKNPVAFRKIYRGMVKYLEGKI